jgi:hypothetical protein
MCVYVCSQAGAGSLKSLGYVHVCTNYRDYCSFPYAFQVRRHEGEEVAEHNTALFIETSALTASNVEELFVEISELISRYLFCRHDCLPFCFISSRQETAQTKSIRRVR